MRPKSSGEDHTNEQHEHEILQLEERRFGAMVRGDVAALDEILSEDLTYTHTSGEVDSKEQFISTLRSGALRYESITPERPQVRVYGSAAIVTGTSLMKIEVHGRNLSFRIRFMDVYAKKHDRWEMVAWQATRLPQE